jgi:hypothetical protein
MSTQSHDRQISTKIETIPCSVSAGRCSLELSAGACVLMRRSSGRVTIFSLHGNRAASVILCVDGRSTLPLTPGEFAAIYQFGNPYESFPNRNVTTRTLSNEDILAVGEFSPFNMLLDEPLLLALHRSRDIHEHNLSERLLKTAACLQLVTADHGAYTRILPALHRI